MINEKDILSSKILIVDDQEFNLLLLEQILRDAGYTDIASTINPHDVCTMHAQHHYDLILLDLLMPRMNGFEVMEGLKKIEIGSYLPVLVITAQPEEKLRALAAGAKDFITKPFDVTEVVTRIHNMLEVRLLYKEQEHYNDVLEHYNEVLGRTVLEKTAELRESEARFRRLTELSSDWYWEQDENGQFTKIFGPVNEMLGIYVDDTLCRTNDAQGAVWDAAERKILEENLAARKPFLDFVYSRTNPDGSRQYLMVSGEPMFDGESRFTGYRGIGKDVTETILAKHSSNDTDG